MRWTGEIDARENLSPVGEKETSPRKRTRARVPAVATRFTRWLHEERLVKPRGERGEGGAERSGPGSRLLLRLHDSRSGRCPTLTARPGTAPQGIVFRDPRQDRFKASLGS
ncbi:unnamed protein product [Lampetra fluviatilis]